MGFLSRLNDIRQLATHNLWRQRTRNAIMTLVLALGITAYMVVTPILEAMTDRAVARTSPLSMPADLTLVIRHIVRYDEINEYDPTKNVQDLICPLSSSSRVLPWDALKGFRAVEFATIEPVLSAAGAFEAIFASPGSSWFIRSINIQSGRAPSGPDEVLLPRWFAERAGVAPGQTTEFVFTNPPLHQYRRQSFVVSGVFTTDFKFADVPLFWDRPVHNHSLTELSELELRQGNARLLAMFDLGGNRPDVQQAARVLTEAFATPPSATANSRMRLSVITGFSPDTPEIMARALAADVHMPAANALVLSFVFVAVGLFTVMLLSFFDRRRDIAIMKTVGISNTDVALIIIGEIVVVTVVGVAMGASFSSYVTRSLARSAWAGVVMVKWSNIIRGSLIGFLVMFLSALFPISLARSATVNQLLYDQKIYLFHRRITPVVKGPAATGKRGA